MTGEAAKSSDQLPEEGPPEVVVDDDAAAEEGAARAAAREHARRANRSGHGPGDSRDDG
ncbi:MAG TPA: hypothetical protein VID68_08775 [Solirubrobacteraceae bacterium]